MAEGHGWSYAHTHHVSFFRWNPSRHNGFRQCAFEVFNFTVVQPQLGITTVSDAVDWSSKAAADWEESLHSLFARCSDPKVPKLVPEECFRLLRWAWWSIWVAIAEHSRKQKRTICCLQRPSSTEFLLAFFVLIAISVVLFYQRTNLDDYQTLKLLEKCLKNNYDDKRHLNWPKIFYATTKLLKLIILNSLH